MFDRLTLVFLAFVLALLGLTTLVRADDAARDLVERLGDRYRAVRTERETLDVLVVSAPQKETYTWADAQALLRDGGTGVRHKRAVRQVAYAEDRSDRIHIVFSLPKEDAGTGFLVLRHPDTGQDDQWLFLPSLRKARRVPVSSTATFVGTNFLYEDVRELAGGNTKRFTHESAGSETVAGRACSVIVSKPLQGTTSAYASRKLWIDPERSFVLQVDYYDAAQAPWKRLRAAEIKEVSAGTFRADLTEMRDMQLNEATLLIVSERRVGLEIPPEVFTRDYLEGQRAP